MAAPNLNKGGQFATSRRGGIDAWECAFIRQKRAQGVSNSSIANMLGRPVATVRAVPAIAAATELEPKPEPAKPTLGPKMVAKRPRPVASSKPRPRIMPERARRAVEALAAFHGVTFEALVGKSSAHRISAIRQEAFWILRHRFRKPNGEPSYSLPLIGCWFGARDHTTVSFGIERHAERLEKALKETAA